MLAKYKIIASSTHFIVLTHDHIFRVEQIILVLKLVKHYEDDSTETFSKLLDCLPPRPRRRHHCTVALLQLRCLPLLLRFPVDQIFNNHYINLMNI